MWAQSHAKITCNVGNILLAMHLINKNTEKMGDSDVDPVDMDYAFETITHPIDKSSWIYRAGRHGSWKCILRDVHDIASWFPRHVWFYLHPSNHWPSKWHLIGPPGGLPSDESSSGDRLSSWHSEEEMTWDNFLGGRKESRTQTGDPKRLFDTYHWRYKEWVFTDHIWAVGQNDCCLVCWMSEPFGRIDDWAGRRLPNLQGYVSEGLPDTTPSSCHKLL